MNGRLREHNGRDQTLQPHPHIIIALYKQKLDDGDHKDFKLS